MKRLIAALLPLLILLAGCGARETEDRAAAIQETYAALAGYDAVAEVELVRGAGNLRYSLHIQADAEGICVTVLAPETLAGVTAHLAVDTLKLEYDGIVLDAGGPLAGLNAVTSVPLVLRAAAEGWLVEQSEETFDEVEHALRACWESESGGEKLLCTVWFDASGAPLYAEIEKKEETAVFMEFTSFTFGDIITADEAA